MRSIRDIALYNKTVFLRVDFNVPLSADGTIADDTRIKAVLPTISYILSKQAKLIIASHLGRPHGKVVSGLRLAPVAQRLQQLLGQPIHYVPDCIGIEVDETKTRLQPGEILLLENVRFHQEETANDMHFAEVLAEGIDVYISDAFGALHRQHATTHALPSLIFDRGVGFLIEQEIQALEQVTQEPRRPLVTIMGGGKVTDKIDLLRRIAHLSDIVLIGGAMANTFVHALGGEVGRSIMDSAQSDTHMANQEALALWNEFSSQSSQQFNIPRLQLPLDYIAVPYPADEHLQETQVIALAAGQTVPADWMCVDIGPATIQHYTEIIKQAATIFWNGPLGWTEYKQFAVASQAIATSISTTNCYSVIGGGDTQAFLKTQSLNGRFSHLSTGGGASLEYIATGTLPGLDVLNS